MKRILVLLIISAIVGWGLWYFFWKDVQKRTAGDTNNTFVVTTSIYPLWFFTHEIAGPHADVTSLVPSGAEPHDYDLTPKDMVRLQQSDLIVLLGGGFESWTSSVEGPTLIVGPSLMTREIEDHDEKIQDPHIWLDPLLAMKIADSIASTVSEKDPEHASTYQERSMALKQRLQTLHTAYTSGLSSCTHKMFVTSHEAFGYLADRYGLTQVAIAGLSPEEEPSPARMIEIAKEIKRTGISYIFFESTVSPELSETLAQETGARTLVLDPIEGLSDDHIQGGATYFSQMEQNLKHLKLALSCT